MLGKGYQSKFKNKSKWMMTCELSMEKPDTDMHCILEVTHEHILIF